jgi:hypothetical protein
MTYTNINGYNIPDLALPPQPEVTLGKVRAGEEEISDGASQGTVRRSADNLHADLASG